MIFRSMEMGACTILLKLLHHLRVDVGCGSIILLLFVSDRRV